MGVLGKETSSVSLQGTTQSRTRADFLRSLFLRETSTKTGSVYDGNIVKVTSLLSRTSLRKRLAAVGVGEDMASRNRDEPFEWFQYQSSRDTGCTSHGSWSGMWMHCQQWDLVFVGFDFFISTFFVWFWCNVRAKHSPHIQFVLLASGHDISLLLLLLPLLHLLFKLEACSFLAGSTPVLDCSCSQVLFWRDNCEIRLFGTRSWSC